jgi:outer membrane beta-barrel protein
VRTKISFISFAFVVLSSIGVGVPVFAWPDSNDSYGVNGGNQGRIDGVPVDAVETFPTVKTNEIEIGVGLFPFNAYYYGLSVGVGYTYNFNNTFGWEVLHADQYFSVEKGLTTELANNYQVNPQSIEELRYDFSSDMSWVFANGKFAFDKDYIRYFRAALLLGPGVVSTDQRSEFAASFGLKTEFFTGDSLVWKFEARDSLPFGGIGNVLSFQLGTGIRF